MHIEGIWNRYDLLRTRAFEAVYSLDLAKKICLAIGMAVLTGICAQVRIVLPFTPVPITGQVFAVLLSGVLLGGRMGSLSQIIYLALGLAGVPWFAGFRGGLSVLSQPTFGYIVGFVFASFFIGHFTGSYVSSRKYLPQFILMIAGILIIYTFGALYLKLVLITNWSRAFFLGVLPFFMGDIIKAVLAAGISTLILPKK